MGKYTPLRNFLSAQAGEAVEVTFAELETLLSAPLPDSKRYPAWWSNNPSNNPMTREWLAVGFRTERVNTARETLTFRRAPQQQEAGIVAGDAGRLVQPPLGFHPLFGCMSGLGRAAPGVVLSEPADPELADYMDEAYGSDAGRPAA